MTEPPTRSELTWKYGSHNEIINPKLNGKKISKKRAQTILLNFSQALSTRRISTIHTKHIQPKVSEETK